MGIGTIATCIRASIIFGTWYCNDVPFDVIGYIGKKNKEKDEPYDPDLCYGRILVIYSWKERRGSVAKFAYDLHLSAQVKNCLLFKESLY